MRNGLSNASRVERYIKHSGRRRTLPALILLALEILFFSFSLSFVSRGGGSVEKNRGKEKRRKHLGNVKYISLLEERSRRRGNREEGKGAGGGTAG